MKYGCQSARLKLNVIWLSGCFCDSWLTEWVQVSSTQLKQNVSQLYGCFCDLRFTEWNMGASQLGSSWMLVGSLVVSMIQDLSKEIQVQVSSTWAECYCTLSLFLWSLIEWMIYGCMWAWLSEWYTGACQLDSSWMLFNSPVVYTGMLSCERLAEIVKFWGEKVEI